VGALAEVTWLPQSVLRLHYLELTGPTGATMWLSPYGPGTWASRRMTRVPSGKNTVC